MGQLYLSGPLDEKPLLGVVAIALHLRVEILERHGAPSEAVDPFLHAPQLVLRPVVAHPKAFLLRVELYFRLAVRLAPGLHALVDARHAGVPRFVANEDVGALPFRWL